MTSRKWGLRARAQREGLLRPTLDPQERPRNESTNGARLGARKNSLLISAPWGGADAQAWPKLVS